MRFLRLVFFVAFVASSVLPGLSAAEGASDSDVCQSVYDMARQIMKARQSGVAMPKMIKIAAGDEAGILKTMVVAAYEMPRMSGEKFQQRLVDQFSDKYYLACIK